MDLIGEFPL